MSKEDIRPSSNNEKLPGTDEAIKEKSRTQDMMNDYRKSVIWPRGVPRTIDWHHILNNPPTQKK